MKKQRSDRFQTRSSALLLHLTSLPGPHGSGDLGGAQAVLDFMNKAGFGWWQMLPVHPPNGYASPYQSPSSFAGHAGLIDLSSLVREGWIPSSSLTRSSLDSGEHCDFKQSGELRERLLRRAFSSFAKASPPASKGFKAFQKAQAYWLEDWTLFSALSAERSKASWKDWEPELRDRVPRALLAARKRLRDELHYHAFVQYAFDQNWQEFRRQAAAAGVRLLGDLPKFVASDSADAWAQRDLFCLDANGRIEREAGTPPDDFSRHGQRWGVPTYRVKKHRSSKFKWWIERVRRELELFDGLRLDHFIGYARTYSVARGVSGKPDSGRYEAGLGQALFKALASRFGPLPFVVEDLGDSGPDVESIREQFGFPGMKVLQFGLDGLHGDNPYLPHNWTPETVAYTGTHDNPTTVGWFRAHAAKPGSRSKGGECKRSILEYTGGKGPRIHLELIRLLWTSVANTVIVPAQDLLGLGAEARMNIPGRATGNWSWRLSEAALTDELASSLHSLSHMTGRLTQHPAKPS